MVIDDFNDFLRIASAGGQACVEWPGHKNRDGYGVITLSRRTHAARRTFLVHRLVYEQAVGDIPDGALICHRCDNPACSNVEHLYAGDSKTNARDMVEHGRALCGSRSPRARLVEDDVRRICDLVVARELPTKEIAEMFGVSPATIRAIFLRSSGRTWTSLPETAGVELQRLPTKRGHKLTLEQATAVKALRDSGRTQQSVADEYGVTQVLVGQIWRGKAWKHS